MNISYCQRSLLACERERDIYNRLMALHEPLQKIWQWSSTHAPDEFMKILKEYEFVKVIEDRNEYYQNIDIIEAFNDHKPLKRGGGDKIADYIILIGIGGSSMGTLAVYHALAHHLPKDAAELICLDTVDPLVTVQLLARIENILQTSSYIVCIISKSGTTLESNINATLVIDLLQRYHPATYRNNVIVVSDDDSPLEQWARNNCRYFASVPQHVGGRFSVFSAVGIIPLGLLGIDIAQLREGALRANHDTWSGTSAKDDAITSAYYLASSYEAGMYIHNWFIFAPHYYHIGLWYRQLLAESIGKQSPHGPVGITPTVALGAVDLHSVAQLYLAGPNNTTTNFLHVTCAEQHNLVIPQSPLLPNMTARTTVADVHLALYRGILSAYEQRQRSYLETHLTCSAFDIGYLMQMQMISMTYLGRLLDVNTFDQPDIAVYKKAAQQYLYDDMTSTSVDE